MSDSIVTLIPASRYSDQGQGLPFVQVKRHTIDRVDAPLVEAKARDQIADLQYPAVHTYTLHFGRCYINQVSSHDSADKLLNRSVSHPMKE
jgi:hypothetical protein